MSSIGGASGGGTTGARSDIKNIKSLKSEVLDLPPSCLEFSTKYPDYFVIGTYHLEKEDGAVEEATLGQELKKLSLQDQDVSDTDGTNTSRKGPTASQTRSGSLLLYRVKDEELEFVHAVTYPSAILDLHFSPHTRDNFLVASSTGTVSLFALKMEPRPHIAHIDTYTLFDNPSTMILSLAWHRSFPDLFGATFSTGTVGLFQLSPSRQVVVTLRDDLSPHGDNCWTLAFAPTDHPRHRSTIQGVYSGGDDSRLRFVEVSSLKELNLDAKTLGERSTGGLAGLAGHGAGVTAILPLPIDTVAGENILLTGSYDDKVRVFAMVDFRPHAPTARPKVLAELDLGGGVWRLKFLKEYETCFEAGTVVRYRVLASCMFVGARVLEVEGSKEGEWSIRVLAAFEDHKSMCYASDVKPGDDDRSGICVSSSFYDRLLCLWKFEE